MNNSCVLRWKVGQNVLRSPDVVASRGAGACHRRADAVGCQFARDERIGNRTLNGVQARRDIQHHVHQGSHRVHYVQRIPAGHRVQGRDQVRH